MKEDVQVIVVGSGISGGWAAKELTEAGLNVLMIERGRMIEHGTGYRNEWTPPWEMPFRGVGDTQQTKRDYAVQSGSSAFNEWSQDHFVNDAENPYQASKPFTWIRGYQMGGRSLIWGRQCYRWSDQDFSANKLDGHGEDWPIRYADLAPWYDHVERFIGVSGSKEGLPQLPDGQFQPPMAMNTVEHAFAEAVNGHYEDRRLIIGRTANLTQDLPGRSKCQYRGICERGCSFGAYFSTQSSTLPAAVATGRLTVLTDHMVDNLTYDQRRRRVTGVNLINTITGERRHVASRVVFLCAGSINSVSILLRSRSDATPNGLGNAHDRLGRFFMDHGLAMSVIADVPGFADREYHGNSPNCFVIPRYINVNQRHSSLLRGYSFQGLAYRKQWTRGFKEPGIGVDFKNKLRRSGDWQLLMGGFAEAMPVPTNRVSLDKTAVDRFGVAQTHINFEYQPNDRALLEDAKLQAAQMVSLIGARPLLQSADPGPGGSAIHEMGGAAMGRDPRTSVLNAHNQLHEAPNVFVTDGAAMASSACQNPSLTYMALTARAASAAASQIKQGIL